MMPEIDQKIRQVLRDFRKAGTGGAPVGEWHMVYRTEAPALLKIFIDDCDYPGESAVQAAAIARALEGQFLPLRVYDTWLCEGHFVETVFGFGPIRLFEDVWKIISANGIKAEALVLTKPIWFRLGDRARLLPVNASTLKCGLEDYATFLRGVPDFAFEHDGRLWPRDHIVRWLETACDALAAEKRK